MPSLYEIDAKYAALQSVLETLNDNGGVLTPELESILDLDGAQWAEKAENYLRVIANLEADATACATELARLKANKDSYERQAEMLSDRLRDSLLARGGDPVAVGTWRLSLRKSEAVEIDPEIALPTKYTIEKTTHTPDKITIKAALKVGINIPGASIVTRHSLQVK